MLYILQRAVGKPILVSCIVLSFFANYTSVNFPSVLFFFFLLFSFLFSAIFFCRFFCVVRRWCLFATRTSSKKRKWDWSLCRCRSSHNPPLGTSAAGTPTRWVAFAIASSPFRLPLFKHRTSIIKHSSLKPVSLTTNQRSFRIRGLQSVQGARGDNWSLCTRDPYIYWSRLVACGPACTPLGIPHPTSVIL